MRSDPDSGQKVAQAFRSCYSSPVGMETDQCAHLPLPGACAQALPGSNGEKIGGACVSGMLFVF